MWSTEQELAYLKSIGTNVKPFHPITHMSKAELLKRYRTGIQKRETTQEFNVERVLEEVAVMLNMETLKGNQ